MDQLFREAVAAIDAGDLAGLDRILTRHPELLHQRLESPGDWLRNKIGGAAGGFFARPYLLWFVAEDPVRNGTLPGNIGSVTRAIIAAARRHGVASLQDQLDQAIRLVAWSWIAARCGVQLELIDALADAGASLAGVPDNALVNGHVAAAEHLVGRGAPISLGVALCLDRWDDVARLAVGASDRERRGAFVLAALNGRAEGLRRMIGHGADVNAPADDLYSHGTPLHHAVCSGNLEAVEVLVEAGARLTTRDTAWEGTPLGWAQHYIGENAGTEREARYRAIAEYLIARS